MIPAQELSLDPIPLFDAALWICPDVESQIIYICDILDSYAHMDCLVYLRNWR